MSHLEVFHIGFVGMFAKFQKVAIYFTMSVCLSVLLSAWNNMTPTGCIIIKFYIWVLFRNLSRKCFIKVGQEYLAQFLLEWKMFQTEVVEKMKTHCIFSNFFFSWKLCRLWDNVEKHTAGQATDDNMAHVHCTLDI